MAESPIEDVLNPGQDFEFIGDSECVMNAKYNKGDLTVQFVRDGSIYTYHGVHIFQWTNLLRATSRGWYFNKNIRNRYSFTRG